jgi:flagellar hook-basal body complex protein FliE
MAIDKLTAIENVLAQMRAVASSAQAGGVFGAQGAAQAAQSGGFASELSRTLEKVAEMQNSSAAQARAFQMGDPNVSLNNVMIDMQKASIAFQATVQARNRLVAAYQEIAGMPI